MLYLIKRKNRDNMQVKRDVYVKYAQEEVAKHHYDISEEDLQTIYNLVEFFGLEGYRPIINLLTANWQELIDRLNLYSEADWSRVRKVAQVYHLEPKEVALLMEVLEGEDTETQNNQKEPTFTAEDLRLLRQRVAEQEAN